MGMLRLCYGYAMDMLWLIPGPEGIFHRIYPNEKRVHQFLTHPFFYMMIVRRST